VPVPNSITHCYPSKYINVSYLDEIVSRFKKTVTIRESTESGSLLLLCESLEQSVQLRTACSARHLVLMFSFILRTLGVKARLIMSFRPLPLKPSNQVLCLNNRRRKNEKSEVKYSKCVKGEGNATSDVSEVVTSKMSCPEVNECLKGKI